MPRTCGPAGPDIHTELGAHPTSLPASLPASATLSHVRASTPSSTFQRRPRGPVPRPQPPVPAPGLPSQRPPAVPPGPGARPPEPVIAEPPPPLRAAPEGYFHSTMLMQALRMGFFRVRQSRARGGRVAVVLPCFLGFPYCCRFRCVELTVEMVALPALPISLACRAASMAACQDRAAPGVGAGRPAPPQEA